MNEKQTVLGDLGLEGPPKWIIPWSAFVLAVLIGSLGSGEAAIDRGLFVVGIPAAWLVGFVHSRNVVLGAAGWILLLAAGVLLGWLTPSL